MRPVRDRNRHRRRSRDANGSPRLSPDAQSRLRRALLLGRHLRRRLSRHPDTAEYSAHRLCGHRRHLGGQIVCRCHVPGLPPRRTLHFLHCGPLDDQSQACTEIAQRDDRRPFWHSAHRPFDVVLSTRDPHLFGPGRDPVRLGHPV